MANEKGKLKDIRITNLDDETITKLEKLVRHFGEKKMKQFFTKLIDWAYEKLYR